MVGRSVPLPEAFAAPSPRVSVGLLLRLGLRYDADQRLGCWMRRTCTHRSSQYTRTPLGGEVPMPTPGSSLHRSRGNSWSAEVDVARLHRTPAACTIAKRGTRRDVLGQRLWRPGECWRISPIRRRCVGPTGAPRATVTAAVSLAADDGGVLEHGFRDGACPTASGRPSRRGLRPPLSIARWSRRF